MNSSTGHSWIFATGCAAVCAAALLMAGSVHAQRVYKIVGADGRITFSDKQPVAADKVTSTEGGKTGEVAGAALPFDLRQVMAKFPVTLYTSSNCVPCGSGRTLLSGRGIPFFEKTVNTNEDADALQRISGENSLPVLTIGGQLIKGYSSSEWMQFLDAAGYPTSSALPSSYRNPAAAPLVAVQKITPAAPAETGRAKRAPAEPSAPKEDTTANPAGIKF